MSISTSRGHLARLMLFEDAAWCLDVYASSQLVDSETASSFAGLSMMSTWARVVYEGRKVVRHTNENVGVAQLADILVPEESSAVAKARHAAKLLDDNRKSLDTLMADMNRYVSNHRRVMLGNAHKLFIGLVQELGIASYEGHIVLATIPHQIRFDMLDRDPAVNKTAMIDFGITLGRDLQTLYQLGATSSVAPATMDASAFARVSWTDHYVRRFLRRRYAPSLSDDVKLLLLLVEADLNALVHLLAKLSTGHQAAVFRNGMLTVWHALSSLHTVMEANPQANDGHSSLIREHLQSPDVKKFLSSQNRQVRNTFVHYLPPDVALNESKTLFGVVEALNANLSCAELADLTWSVGQQTAVLLETWQSRRDS